MAETVIVENGKSIIKNGLHWLSGIDDVIINVGFDQVDTNAILFCLDGKVYQIYDDPDDGYRSYGTIEESSLTCKHMFEPQAVMAVNKRITNGDDDWMAGDTCQLELRDAITNELVLVIGTDYSDEYYPISIFDYKPENLYINQNQKTDA